MDIRDSRALENVAAAVAIQPKKDITERITTIAVNTPKSPDI